MSDANSIHEVRKELSANPSCRKCGCVMTRIGVFSADGKTERGGYWKCLSCGTTTEPS